MKPALMVSARPSLQKLLLPRDVAAQRIEAALNLSETFRIVITDEGAFCEAAIERKVVSDTTGLEETFAHHRVEAAIIYLQHLLDIWTATNRGIYNKGSTLFQASDVPINRASIAWESKRAWTEVKLVPDLYYFWERGYETFAPELLPWVDRADQLFWRGATTGMSNMTLDDLDDLPRYKLAKLGTKLGALADIRFSLVVQSRTQKEVERISARLQQEGLLHNYVPLDQLGRCRYIIDIDGNANSWHFIKRLRLGCCLLKVESDWVQWFERSFVPWRHYVPVSKDMSDLAEKLDWCRSHPHRAEQIAREGTALATRMSFAEEMETAAQTVFGSLQPAAVLAS